jgi:hypothetical protein
VARAFQQFSRFILGKEDLTQHHGLKQDEVGQSGQVFEPLPRKLGQPGQLLSKAEKAVRHVQGDKLLRCRRRQVERPAPEGAASCDEFRDRDVADGLVTGLRAGDADCEPLDQGRALAGWPSEFVPIYGVYRIDA